jgi:hypothetical protein
MTDREKGPLEREIEREIAFALSETPAARSSMQTGGEAVVGSAAEAMRHLTIQCTALHLAVLRIAREIDQIRTEP